MDYSTLLTTVQQTPQDVRNYVFGSIAPDNTTMYTWDTSKIPKSADMRADTLEMENQLNYGSCVGNSLVAAGEMNLKLNNISLSLSRLYVYYNARARVLAVRQSTDPVTDSGTSIFLALGEMTKNGVCTEDLWSYDQPVNDKPSDAAYTDGKTRLVGRYETLGMQAYIGGSFVDRDKLTDIKVALASNIPVNFGMILHEDFFKISGPLSTHRAQYNPGQLLDNSPGVVGRHAIFMVGYDEENDYIIIENSWGPNWGDKGYAAIRTSVILDNGFDFFAIREFAEIKNTINPDFILHAPVVVPVVPPTPTPVPDPVPVPVPPVDPTPVPPIPDPVPVVPPTPVPPVPTPVVPVVPESTTYKTIGIVALIIGLILLVIFA
jgi:hypothetical protein